MKIFKEKKSKISGWSVASIFFLGGLLGSFALEPLAINQFGENQFVQFAGKTWLPVKGEPVELIILNDENCAECQTDKSEATIAQIVTPVLSKTTIDISSQAGIDLIAKFNIKKLPAYILGAGVETVELPQGKFIKLAEKYLTEKDGQYLMNSVAFQLSISKFIDVPKLADLDTEPRKGNKEALQVIEFADFQCPFSNMFHQKNHELLERLSKEGKINYIRKDFPLVFHKESPIAHQAANCVLANSNNENYWKMNNKIFDNQKIWENTGGSATKKTMIDFAQELEVDITECLNNASGLAEINADIQEGAEYGVGGTPAIFIGKTIISGAVDAKYLEDVINAEMTK
jgi:protein-disulfide isomerase